MYFPLFVGVLCFLCFVVHSFVLSSFAIIKIIDEEKRAGCFAFIVLRMSCYFKCSVTLPHGAVGWSDHTHFLSVHKRGWIISRKQ